jgi:hypothetical protein
MEKLVSPIEVILLSYSTPVWDFHFQPTTTTDAAAATTTK